MQETNIENKQAEVKIDRDAYNKKSFYIFIIFNLITVISLVYYSYNVSKILVLKDTDDKLLAGAYGVTFALGKDFHDKIENASSVSTEEHYENVISLSEVAGKCGADYVYTLMKASNEVVFTSLSVTKEEFEKKNIDKFFTVYKKPSDLVLSSFGSNTVYFEEFEDEYGYFRSVIVPMKTKNNKEYIAGADIAMAGIDRRLDSILMSFIIAGAVIFLATSAAFVFLSKRI